MKRVLLTLFVLSLLFTGCSEDIQNNSPALQSQIDSLFFKATDVRGAQTLGGTGYVLQGVTDDEILTLRVPSTEIGTYTIENNPDVYASFKDFNDNLFLTDPSGEGEIVINNWNSSERTVSGTFRFVAYIPGIDTIFAQKGVFYQVPYDLGYEISDPGLGTGTLFARVDGENYTASNVIGSNNQISIRIRGIRGAEMIDLRTPIDILPGSYDITDPEFFGKYTDLDGLTRGADEGILVVIDHDPITRTIRGTFAFNTLDHSISNGQFNVSY